MKTESELKESVGTDSTIVASGAAPVRRIPLGFLLGAGILTVLFGSILYSVVRLSFRSELHSHLLVIPVLSWFVWRFLDRRSGVGNGGLPSRSKSGAAIAAFFGVASVGAYFLLRGRSLPMTEWLWAGTLGYLFFLLAVALWTVGWSRLKNHKFALVFLLLAVPLPLVATDALSVLLQHGSAEVLDWFLRLSGLPVLRDGLTFRLPTMAIWVAEECSGVRATLISFIFSLFAAKVLLRTPSKCVILALATIPLGLLRNSLRITVLAWLSEHVDRNVIHGAFHHTWGGPVFFALSLVPLFALLWWFLKLESRSNKE